MSEIPTTARAVIIGGGAVGVVAGHGGVAEPGGPRLQHAVEARRKRDGAIAAFARGGGDREIQQRLRGLSRLLLLPQESQSNSPDFRRNNLLFLQARRLHLRRILRFLPRQNGKQQHTHLR